MGFRLREEPRGGEEGAQERERRLSLPWVRQELINLQDLFSPCILQ
jgi:hypothetical protein